MQSFIVNSTLNELDDFRKEVRGKLKQETQITQKNQLQSLLRSSISPPLKSQGDSPGRLSFQRSSLDLSKPTQNLLYPKKQLQDIISLNKIIELQRALNNYNHPVNSPYFVELKKLAKVVLRETQG